MPERANGQQEFVRQDLLVLSFDADRRGLGRRAADEIVDFTDRRVQGRELGLDGRDRMLRELKLAGFDLDSVLLPGEVVTRDSMMRQPIVIGEQRDLGAPAEAFAAELVRARQQLVPVRRGENALHGVKPREAA